MTTVGAGALVGGRATLVGNLATMHQGPLMPWNPDDPEDMDDYCKDPRGFLLDRCQLWTPSCTLMSNLICCATYYLPPYDILPGGQKFYRADISHNEALWQGKVGLVVAKGPLAFLDEPELRIKFHGQNVDIGDWVQWDIHDARQCTINRVHVRYLKDVQIIAKWDDPRLVY